MPKRLLLIAGIILALLVVIAGVGLWNFVLGDTAEASGPIAATPIAVQASATPPALPMEESAVAIELTESELEPESPSEMAIFSIDQSVSEVRFIINEVLRGNPTLVVGISDQVAGEIAIDPNDLSTIRIGPIRINARTFVTNQDRRNQAIRKFILKTDSYEFITFTPNGIIGLEGSGVVGSAYTFQIEGDLTIRDITNPVVFGVSARALSEDQISGTASATIARSDYNLRIPNVPFVANVGEEVLLEIDFTASR